MRAAIRSLMSLDVDDLEGWSPGIDSWAIGLQLRAGPVDGPGEESFDLTVCSAVWLAERVCRDGVVDGRHHLIMEHYDWAVLRAYVERRVRSCQGSTWREVAEQLGRIGFWEFEGYRA